MRGSCPMSESERVLGLLRAMCAALSPGGIDVVADDRRTAFVPAERRIMVARQYLSAETPVAVGAVLHEIGHALVTRYDRFVEPAGAIPSLWLTSSNAAEETRDHCFLRRRLPGVNRYLRALFAADTPPTVAEMECELFAFLMAMASADRFTDFPFLAPFFAAAAAFARTAGARDRYNHALPPPDLMPRPGLSDRYARDVSPVLRRPDEGLVDPVEAEILCAAASARRIFDGDLVRDPVARRRRHRPHRPCAGRRSGTSGTGRTPWQDVGERSSCTGGFAGLDNCLRRTHVAAKPGVAAIVGRPEAPARSRPRDVPPLPGAEERRSGVRCDRARTRGGRIGQARGRPGA